MINTAELLEAVYEQKLASIALELTRKDMQLNPQVGHRKEFEAALNQWTKATRRVNQQLGVIEHEALVIACNRLHIPSPEKKI